MPGPLVVPAEGTTIGYSATLVGTYVLVGNVLNIKPPGAEVPGVEKTNLASAAKEYRAGEIPDNGEVTFRIQHDPSDTGHTALKALLVQGAQRSPKFWKISYNDTMATHASDSFQAILTKYEPDTIENEKNLESDITLLITGLVTRTIGT